MSQQSSYSAAGWLCRPPGSRGPAAEPWGPRRGPPRPAAAADASPSHHGWTDRRETRLRKKRDDEFLITLCWWLPVPMTTLLLGRWACRLHWSAWSARHRWWRATQSARSAPFATFWTTSEFSPAPVYSQLPTHSWKTSTYKPHQTLCVCVCVCVRGCVPTCEPSWL